MSAYVNPAIYAVLPYIKVMKKKHARFDLLSKLPLLTNRREAKNNAKNLTPEATPTSTNIAFMKAQQKHFI